MRYSLLILLAVVPVVAAQDSALQITKVRIGFQPYSGEEAGGAKVGLWAPVHIQVKASKAGFDGGTLTIETPDSEDAGTIYPVAVPELKDESRWLEGYVRPLRSTIKVQLKRDRDTIKADPIEPRSLDLTARLYLCLGTKLEELPAALKALRQRQDDKPGDTDSWPRYGAWEDKVPFLPRRAFGYDAVDVVVLTTGNAEFVDALRQDRERLAALAGWVRQGGRLVVAVSGRNQAAVHDLLQAPAWTPAIPVTPRRERRLEAKKARDQLSRIETWAGVQGKPFNVLRQDLADLDVERDAGRNWEVLAEHVETFRPLITRQPYGLGSITFLAFDLENEPFRSWNGKTEFLSGLVRNVEPPVTRQDRPDRFRGDYDLTTQLQRELDNFGVPVISFGWVALFIFIYILIIGPVDYFVLKKVFNKLELTWITFPAIVIVVSATAYFTAYAVKGKDLKINQLDVIDFDLRTGQGVEPGRAYGQSFVTIMSPRIGSYTVGLTPALDDWGLAARGDNPSAEPVTWLGRPEPDGPGNYNRGRSTFFRRPYEYAPDARGLRGVSIPFSTTKAFSAAWEVPLVKAPIDSDLVYFPPDSVVKVSGKLKSRLPLALEDVWIFYRGKVHPLRSLVPGEEINLELGGDVAQLQGWARHMDRPIHVKAGEGVFFDPTPTMKEILFHERVDAGQNNRNHALGRLDLSWRLREDEKDPSGGNRDIILYGRVARHNGPAQELAQSKNLPTSLWLGALPGDGKDRPALEGTLVQDTFVRVIIPVRAKN